MCDVVSGNSRNTASKEFKSTSSDKSRTPQGLRRPAETSIEPILKDISALPEVLEQLDEITSNSASLDYLAARAGYMKLTLGQPSKPATHAFCFVNH